LGSTNGTYYKGKQIKKQKLQAGDRVGIGRLHPDRGCGDKHVLELPPSYIIVQTGKTRGQKKKLTPPSSRSAPTPAVRGPARHSRFASPRRN
jgi:pSer/pThr/pTyr-binding forkhead associated (FHA) protein